jgi:Ca2+-transporting ATPase
MDGVVQRRGLSAAEAAARLHEHGPNRPPEAPPRDWLRRVGDQLRDPMILLLLGAFVVTVVLRDVSDAIIIMIVVTLNSGIGVFQEVRAEHAVAALNRMAAPHATVLRDGRPVTVDAAEVVPGDLLRLDAGDIVPADATLDDAFSLQVDESAMTGESVPVDRDRGMEVLAGTVVTRGRGLATVTRTGAQSGLGRIAAMIAGAGLRPTPLQKRLKSLSQVLVTLVLALAAVVFLLGLVRGQDPAEMLILAVSLAVAAIPESLPAVVSVALAMGAYRMARRSAIVRWLPAVETLGSVTVLASDKTGTLTEGRMVVQRLWTPTAEYDVTGRGYDRAGAVVRRTDGGADPLLRRLLVDLVLCNDAHLGGSAEDRWTVVGDPMEAALLVAADKGGAPQSLRETWTRVEELPFDSQRQRMTTVQRSYDGPWRAVCKGAPEVVLDLAEGPVEAARAEAHALADQGFRVMAVADADHARMPGTPEAGLSLVGLVAISDPAREGARQVVEDCQAAGIRLVLITGDHPATARAIAGGLGITEAAPEVADGSMVARGEHVDRVDEIGVYARTKPEQKVDIVQAWQRRGDVVAMTGDGVNDAPALRIADIGVAMGERGTEVARQAADLVLADDDLRTVVVAVGEGRRIFTNIRTFLRYGLSGGLAEVAVILLAPFLGMPLPLLPAQILWINMLTHGLPGVAFGGEPLDPSVMRRPSMPPQKSVLGESLWRQILTTGAVISVVSIAAGLLATAYSGHVQTWIFLTLGLAQLGVALALRAPRKGASWKARGLEYAVLGAALLQVAGILVPALRDLLGTRPVTWDWFLILFGMSLVPGLVIAVLRWVSARRAAPVVEERTE